MGVLNTVFGKVVYETEVVQYRSLHEPLEFKAKVKVPKVLASLLSRVVELVEATNRTKVKSWHVRENRKTCTLTFMGVTKNNYWDLVAVRSAVEVAFHDFLVHPDSEYRILERTKVDDCDVILCYKYDDLFGVHLDLRAIIMSQHDLSDRFITVTKGIYVMYRSFSLDLDLDVAKQLLLNELKEKLHSQEPEPNIEKLYYILCGTRLP